MPVIEIFKGEEGLATNAAKAKGLSVANGEIVFLVGSSGLRVDLEHATDDPLTDIITMSNSMELSGTDEITNGAVHLHVVLGPKVTEPGQPPAPGHG